MSSAVGLDAIADSAITLDDIAFEAFAQSPRFAELSVVLDGVTAAGSAETFNFGFWSDTSIASSDWTEQSLATNPWYSETSSIALLVYGDGVAFLDEVFADTSIDPIVQDEAVTPLTQETVWSDQ